MQEVFAASYVSVLRIANAVTEMQRLPFFFFLHSVLRKNLVKSAEAETKPWTLSCHLIESSISFIPLCGNREPGTYETWESDR